ncbi:YbaN family protein [Brucepastera parasyntrophica]|uniref:YbaN family protein n=1 Tax=Brucepastera parasyntrophica TaxID=2880008 RepID=UPI002108FBA1|nr:YbaN family protein [Brucepastera parasyntrophica]ULQ59502.1 YbaN family protein [Brucepastera parasyntrophica]
MRKILLLAAGVLALLLGTVGIFLPILPTTPFVLLAGICFSFSSQKAYNLLLKSRFFGPYIENYRTKKGVPVAAKVRGIVSLWLLLAVSAFAMAKVWSTIMFAAVGTGVTIHLLLMKTWRPEKQSLPEFSAAEEIEQVSGEA